MLCYICLGIGIGIGIGMGWDGMGWSLGYLGLIRFDLVSYFYLFFFLGLGTYVCLFLVFIKCHFGNSLRWDHIHPYSFFLFLFSLFSFSIFLTLIPVLIFIFIFMSGFRFIQLGSSCLSVCSFEAFGIRKFRRN